MMTQALGTIATVRKTRILMMRDNVRLHLDRIDGSANSARSKRYSASMAIPKAVGPRSTSS